MKREGRKEGEVYNRGSVYVCVRGELEAGNVKREGTEQKSKKGHLTYLFIELEVGSVKKEGRKAGQLIYFIEELSLEGEDDGR